MADKRTMEVSVSNELRERLNKLLDINDFEDVSENERESLGIEEDCCKELYNVQFPDGTKLCVELCSGQTNYWLEASYALANQPDYFIPMDDVFYELGKKSDEFTIPNENGELASYTVIYG